MNLKVNQLFQYEKIQDKEKICKFSDHLVKIPLGDRYILYNIGLRKIFYIVLIQFFSTFSGQKIIIIDFILIFYLQITKPLTI